MPIVFRQWSGEAGGLGDPYAPGMGNPGYDAWQYDLNFTLAISPTQPSARATVVAKIGAKVTAPQLDRLALDFAPTTINEVRVDDAPATWYSGPGQKLWVVLPQTLHEGQFIGLKITYTLVAGNNGSGLNVGRVGQGDARIWTSGNASTWFPANDYPGDRALFQLTITAPNPYVSVANGDAGRHFEQGATTTTTFGSATYLMPSDITLQVARFNIVDGITDHFVPVHHYLLSPVEKMRPILKVIERQLDYFINLITYPYESFGVVESGEPNSSAVASLILLGQNQLSQRPVYFERNFGSLVASQWFASNIGLNNLADAWMPTGLDTYLGLLYLARDQGPEIVQARLNAYESTFAYTVPTDMPLATLPPGSAGAAIRTNKAPMAFHRLHLALGDVGFKAMLINYFTNRQQMGHDLDTLRYSAEAQVAGRSLAPLFDTLFRQAATPRINLAWTQSGTSVLFRMCQLTAQPVRFMLPIALHGSDAGNTAAAGDVSQRASLDIRQADQVSRVGIRVAMTVTAITPDPDQELLADVLVHPITGGTLPSCSELPMPAMPTVAGSAARTGIEETGVAADALDIDNTSGDTSGELHPFSSDDQDVQDVKAIEGKQHFMPEQWLGDPATTESRRPGSPGSPGLHDLIDAPDLVPGEPSLGDALIPYLGNTGYDVQHYNIKARIDPLANKVEADTTIEALSTLDGLDRLSLDFMRMKSDKGLAIQALSVNGAPATYDRPADADKLWVDLPAPVAKDQAFTIRVQYSGTPVPGGTDVFSGGLLLFSGQVMYAVSEPDGTRNWIPSNDHPRDKATYHFEITVPKPFVAVANGLPLDKTETPGDTGDTTAVFDMPRPMASYLATVAVGRFRIADQAGPNGVKIRHYFLNDPQVAMGVTPDVLDVYSRLVGQYAFATYGHYAAPQFGGGMENQTMTAVGANVFTTRTPRSSQSLIAHEAAHQWFGDALSPYVWSDIWLNEGFATYFAELWRASRVGPEPLGWRMEALRYTVLSGGRSAPVSQPSLADMFGTNTYEKGGWVLNMLRAEIGDAAFWAGIRAYFEGHKYGTVRTADLQAAMEAASGKDLSAWFGQWVHRGGNPILLAAWGQSGAGRQVVVRLCQPDAVGVPFDLPITLAVHEQAEAIGPTAGPVGGQVVRATGRSNGPDTTLKVDVPAGFAADGVTVDPDFRLLAEIGVQRVAGAEMPRCAAMAAGW